MQNSKNNEKNSSSYSYSDSYFVIIRLFKKPELLNDIWLWLIGLAGLIIKTAKVIIINLFMNL